MFTQIRKALNNSEGAISIFAVLILVFLLPFAIWVGIELPKSHEANQRVKDAVDSAAASAITLVKSEEFADGRILLDKQNANIVAQEIVAEKMGLELKSGKYVPKEGSSIKPDGLELWVTVIDDSNMPNGTPYTVTPKTTGKTWNKKLERPTVVVEAKMTFKKIGWWGNDLTVYQTGMSQVVNNLK